MTVERATLQSFVSSLGYGQLDAQTVYNSKMVLLDTLGAMLAGVEAEEVAIALRTMSIFDLNPQCTVLGHAAKLALPEASFINALSAHVLELDDTHRTGMLHIAAPVIPAALATAELQDSGGRELIAAIVGGFEVAARIAHAVQPSHWHRGFLAMGTCGVFGAAAATAMLLKLDQADMHNAIGLAGMFASGVNTSIFGAGDMGKRIVPANAARAGAFSAFLARNGFTGSEGILEQAKGFCHAYSDEVYLEQLTTGLGKNFEINRTGLKPYACCRFNHAPIDALLDIMARQSLQVGDIEQIAVRTYGIVANDRPHRAAPINVFDAKMSLPFCLSVAAHKGDVPEGVFTEEIIADHSFIYLASQVSISADDAMSAAYPAASPAEVAITTKAGTRHAKLIENPKGEPEYPMTRDEVVAKFLPLARVSLSPGAADAVVEAVEGLDGLSSIRPLMERLRAVG